VVLCATLLRRDWILIALITTAAFFVRLYPAWDAVFGGARVNFLETDAWYHVRLAENQVRNYPWRVTLDPYAAPGGQFVPIAPLFDTITATAVVIVHGRAATPEQVERLAAFVPPVLGAVTVVFAFALARRLLDRRAGLLAAALVAVLPGHFLDRTQLGFVDHHALEACLALATMLTIARATSGQAALPAAAASVGATLGLYLLAWGSGAFLVAIVGVWLILLVPFLRSAEELTRAARVMAVAAVVALGLVLLFQEPRMHRYGSQIVALTGLAALALAIVCLSAFDAATRVGRWILPTLAAGGIVVLVTWLVAPALVTQIGVDVGRLAPDPARMAVLEARPLFLYPGEWNWSQPWEFFRTGFYAGVIAVAAFTVRLWRQRRAADLLLWVFATASLVATIGQNRFGYYLVPAFAVLMAWLAVELLNWAGVPHALDASPPPLTRMPLAREVAVIAVAGGMFAPNTIPSVLLGARSASLAAYWGDAIDALGRLTPPPFAHGAQRGDDFYYARYSPDQAAVPDYTVMNWWDQGYWITQRARRVPVANPTQERAPNAARFYVETDEQRALAMLDAERTRYVFSDWELPFRRTPQGTIMGRFQNIADWAGVSHADYYEIYYRRAAGDWSAVWVFHEAYYRSMAYRLSVLGGSGAQPANATTVIAVATRKDTNGRIFREIIGEQTYPTYDAARSAAAATRMSPADASVSIVIVGLDPWVPAFPIEATRSFVEVYGARTAEQSPAEAPWVRVFEVR
jgi:dolichyl-diphosphooligosaccharide--protein glycosyltransferase